MDTWHFKVAGYMSDYFYTPFVNCIIPFWHVCQVGQKKLFLLICRRKTLGLENGIHPGNRLALQKASADKTWCSFPMALPCL